MLSDTSLLSQETLQCSPFNTFLMRLHPTPDTSHYLWIQHLPIVLNKHLISFYRYILMRFEILPPILTSSESAQAVLKLRTPLIIFQALEPHPSSPQLHQMIIVLKVGGELPKAYAAPGARSVSISAVYLARCNYIALQTHSDTGPTPLNVQASSRCWTIPPWSTPPSRRWRRRR